MSSLLDDLRTIGIRMCQQLYANAFHAFMREVP